MDTARNPTLHDQDAELKARHRAMWASGDYASMVETWLLPVGAVLVDACAVGPGARVLDVAAGTGNAAIRAARRGASVTASDLTPELLEAGRRRAEADGLALEWKQGDAERLPFADLAEHLRTHYGPVIAARANARRTGRERELDEALDRLFDDRNQGNGGAARFEVEYLLAVGTRA